ncbi:MULTISPECIES: LuxR C-terminal-related transcriptional regulator [unclassified Pseudomonas]|jgi:DNA-binding CsgD family transcriptional regulator|uniref:helix-turn-helix transcriptional regulator n=1 Tax=Pseudomonas TaxID=286 RepID=UPI000B3FC429|nr:MULTISPECIES: LuxR C-terminal-related transcriptional regulator [unclassified Pseudomonas]PMU16281.1 helix-turn-helix transcriptional regulator [Pseudomonas sp. GP01-A9]PMU31315.1 helix-turn-helix transcriptional regulator [Pseudomonas sp. GP01-A13]PMU33542.1 helix-turn-helix transcriptional regulator [Pseudomonas sp. GP01-A8]PMU48339.1 helix-turn-helix transcriptional regulator [Pseudomonas sp. GP01-A14]PMU50404.1 helix-turn-helix transcriptional regulator [Pseudomonas sp. GP01-A6]
MTLSLEDIAWHRSVGQMIDALDQPNFWTQLVRLLDQYVPFDSWVVLLFSSEHKPLVFAECPGQDGEPDHLFQDYLNGLYLLDPFYIASREHSRTGLFRLAEVAPEHFELTEYYQRYFRLNVVADEIQFNCQQPDGRTLCLSLGSKQRFDPQQIALLSLIQPWVLGLLRQRLPHELNQVSAPQAPIHNDGWGAQLTARELDVGRLMLSGCSSKEIARKLEISVETVKVHKKHMYSKLGIKSQSELFSIFLQAQNA